jgi:hypothetical protein
LGPCKPGFCKEKPWGEAYSRALLLSADESSRKTMRTICCIIYLPFATAKIDDDMCVFVGWLLKKVAILNVFTVVAFAAGF